MPLKKGKSKAVCWRWKVYIYIYIYIKYKKKKENPCKKHGQRVVVEGTTTHENHRNQVKKREREQDLLEASDRESRSGTN